MVIVQGTFEVEPSQREAYIAETLETQRISRGEPGCHEYVVAPDPLDSGRVILSERWETDADLQAHIAALMDRRKAAAEDASATAVEAISRVIAFYDVAAVREM